MAGQGDSDSTLDSNIDLIDAGSNRFSLKSYLSNGNHSVHVTSILHGHQQIHLGNGFTYSEKHTNLANGATGSHLVVTGANQVHVQYFGIDVEDSPVDVTFYANVVTSDDGTPLTVGNNNFNSVKTPTFTINEGATITDAGDLVSIAYLPNYGGGAGAGGRSVGGTASLAGGEWVLAPNSKYTINIINNSGSVIDYVLTLFSYEPEQGT